ncbi:hypothetical protein RUM43_012494 [Polyplax serrata]|uniref:Uncharacterized protein n=1 Tax=Polyplax serrata TaxID=468196 RepID=A0AAN8NRR2_POLSC
MDAEQSVGGTQVIMVTGCQVLKKYTEITERTAKDEGNQSGVALLKLEKPVKISNEETFKRGAGVSKPFAVERTVVGSERQTSIQSTTNFKLNATENDDGDFSLLLEMESEMEPFAYGDLTGCPRQRLMNRTTQRQRLATAFDPISVLRSFVLLRQIKFLSVECDD